MANNSHSHTHTHRQSDRERELKLKHITMASHFFRRKLIGYATWTFILPHSEITSKSQTADSEWQIANKTNKWSKHLNFTIIARVYTLENRNWNSKNKTHIQIGKAKSKAKSSRVQAAIYSRKCKQSTRVATAGRRLPPRRQSPRQIAVGCAVSVSAGRR